MSKDDLSFENITKAIRNLNKHGISTKQLACSTSEKDWPTPGDFLRAAKHVGLRAQIRDEAGVEYICVD